MKKVILLLFVFSVLTVMGQSQSDISLNLNQLAEIYIEENEDAGDFTEVYEWMMDLHTHQLDINQASMEELLALPFMTYEMARTIQEHKKRFGLYSSEYELQVLPIFSESFKNKVLPFLRVRSPNKSVKELLASSKHQVLLRYADDLEKPLGYTNEKFAGNLGALYARYQLNMDKTVSAGFVIENDAYEPLFDSNNRAFDYWSAHLQVRDIGIFKSINLGDFQANFGQGLVLGSGFGGFKSYESTVIGSAYQGLKKYSSVNENLFLRGGGATVELRDWRFTGLYSSKKVDASIATTVDSSEAEEVFFSTLQTSGLHRTESELSSKQSLQKTDLGFNAQWGKPKYRIGFTYLRTNFSESRTPQSNLYRRVDLVGDEYHFKSLSYQFLYKNLFLLGEAALVGDKWASLSKVLLNLSKSSEALIVYRNYAPGYVNFNGRAFGEKATINNESGLYVGFKTQFHDKWILNAYADFYSFPWLRYGVSAPSRGEDYTFKLLRKINKQTHWYLRYKKETWQENVQEQLTRLGRVEVDRFRLHVQYPITASAKGSSRVEWSQHKENGTRTEGWLFYQDVRTHISSNLVLGTRFTLFNTDDYNTRIYAYEQDVLYRFSVPVFYDRGYRWYAVIQYKLDRTITLQGKYSYTTFLDRETIGTGNAALNTNERNQFTVQLRLRW